MAKSKEEILELLKDGVINYKEDQVKEASQESLDVGFTPLEMIMDGLAAGMEVSGSCTSGTSTSYRRS